MRLVGGRNDGHEILQRTTQCAHLTIANSVEPSGSPTAANVTLPQTDDSNKEFAAGAHVACWQGRPGGQKRSLIYLTGIR